MEESKNDGNGSIVSVHCDTLHRFLQKGNSVCCLRNFLFKDGYDKVNVV